MPPGKFSSSEGSLGNGDGSLAPMARLQLSIDDFDTSCKYLVNDRSLRSSFRQQC